LHAQSEEKRFMLRDLLQRAAKRLPGPFGRALDRLAASDAVFLVRAFLAVAAVWFFIALASEVGEGETLQLDKRIVRSLRAAADPAIPIGPAWLAGAMRDLTSLGSNVVLLLFTAAVAVFFAVRRQTHALALVVVSTGGGFFLAQALKLVFARPRPDIVPHLATVTSSSFPSGHSMFSAVVYLTLGALLSQMVEERSLKLYFLAVACFLTLVVGVSRVFLGVHYPTDVLAGWAAGLAWAVLCWMVASYLQRRGAVEPPR
jgi:undecaprenyl-diphosphatase